MRRTYWLYYGKTPITAVILDGAVSTATVVAKALEQHSRVPLPHEGLNPGEVAAMIRRSEIRTFAPMFN